MNNNQRVFKLSSAQGRIQSFAFIIAVVIAILFSVGFVISSFSESHNSNEINLEERINPNEASMESLKRLPGVGISRAKAIVAYREDWFKYNPDQVAFKDCNDLQKVRGIGQKTATNVCEWLRFE